MNLFLSYNTLFFILWIIPVFYGFYKYCKYTEFRKVSLLHYMLSNLVVTFAGFLTGMFVIDAGFVLLLFFTDLFIRVGRYYLVEKTTRVAMLLLVYFSVVIISYFLTTKCKNSTLSKALSSLFLIGVFILGIKGFFYYLEHNFRK